MKNFKAIFILPCLIILLCSAGCAWPQNGDSATQPQQAAPEPEGKVMSVQRGVVQHVRDVKVAVGKGGVIGSTAGTFSLFINGLLNSSTPSKGPREVEAQEITLMLDSGKEIIVVQEKDDFFKNGDRVRLVTGPDGTARVQNE